MWFPLTLLAVPILFSNAIHLEPAEFLENAAEPGYHVSNVRKRGLYRRGISVATGKVEAFAPVSPDTGTQILFCDPKEKLIMTQ
jgi:hypothetical protein